MRPHEGGRAAVGRLRKGPFPVAEPEQEVLERVGEVPEREHVRGRCETVGQRERHSDVGADFGAWRLRAVVFWHWPLLSTLAVDLK
ncbi:hypothetical protein GCM10009849_35300 [Sinomonas flava]|uniref:Uncharacterized protein n=1 Tax=Sinomonas flava TaxID=496857 RepID=A0ABN3C2V4_9MICC